MWQGLHLMDVPGEGGRNQVRHLYAGPSGGCVVLSSELEETEEGAGFGEFYLSSRHPLRDGGQGVKHRWLETVQNGKVLILR